MPIGSTPLNDGHHIPNLAFGTGTTLKGKDAQDAVTAALHAGFRHIDTAQLYGNEQTVGDGIWAWLEGDSAPVRGAIARNEKLGGQVALRGPKREDVWVTTKLGSSDKGAVEELKESLKKLRLDYVDLYLIHAPWLIKGKVEAVWREMEQGWPSESIGVSNFDATDLYELLQIAKIKPAVNQVRYYASKSHYFTNFDLEYGIPGVQIHLHPYIYQTSLATLQFCKANGITVEAYGSLYPITQLPNGPVTPTLKGPSERLGASLGQVIFLWVRAKECVVVTTTNREERLREYLGVGELRPLTEEEVRKIDEAAASLYPRITSHVRPPPSVMSKEKEPSLPQYTTTVKGQSGPSERRRKTFAFLLYGGIMLSMHALRNASQYCGPPEISRGMRVLNILVDIVCVILWRRALRKNPVVEEPEVIVEKGEA